MNPDSRRFTLAWFVALVSVLVLTFAVTRDWDTRDVVFWGVMALWWQQVALDEVREARRRPTNEEATG